MEPIDNYDLKDVYCPYRQGRCLSTCALLVRDSYCTVIGTHSWEDDDGYPRVSDVYQSYTVYWCGSAHTEEGACANMTRINGPVVCDGKPFNGFTDKQIRERKAAEIEVE